MMYELINNVPIQIKEYKGQRVVTFKDIDRVHNRPEGTARKRFNDNRKRFIEGVDFFYVKPADVQMSEIRTSEINNRGTILLTENGYLMLVKSFTDDLAWDVQRQLVNTYFRVKELTTLTTKEFADIELIKETIDSALTEKTEEIVIKTVQTLIPCFDMLNRKIDSVSKFSDKRAENILIRAVKKYAEKFFGY